MACCEEMQAAVDETRAKEHARLKLVSDSILGSYERAHEVSDLNALRAARRREIQNARAERDARREQGYGAFKEVEAADLDAEVGLAIVRLAGGVVGWSGWLAGRIRVWVCFDIFTKNFRENFIAKMFVRAKTPKLFEKTFWAVDS